MCTPAQIYLLFHFYILSMMMQNIQDPHSYCTWFSRAQSQLTILFTLFLK